MHWESQFERNSNIVMDGLCRLWRGRLVKYKKKGKIFSTFSLNWVRFISAKNERLLLCLWSQQFSLVRFVASSLTYFLFACSNQC